MTFLNHVHDVGKPKVAYDCRNGCGSMQNAVYKVFWLVGAGNTIQAAVLGPDHQWQCAANLHHTVQNHQLPAPVLWPSRLPRGAVSLWFCLVSQIVPIFSIIWKCIYAMGWSGKFLKILQNVGTYNKGYLVYKLLKVFGGSISSPCENIYQ